MSSSFRRGRSVRLASPPTDSSPSPPSNNRSPAAVNTAASNSGGENTGSSRPSPTSPVDKSRLTRDAFYKDYGKFTSKNPQNFTVSHKEIDLFKLFLNVQERNGYSAVTGQNSWIPVFLDVTGSETYSSNTGYYLKLNYERHLLKFEQKAGSKYRVDANKVLPNSPAEYAAKNKRQYNEELGLSPSASTQNLRKQRGGSNRRFQTSISSRHSDTDSELNDNLADAIYGGKTTGRQGGKHSRLDTSTDDNSEDEYDGALDDSILAYNEEFESKLEAALSFDDPIGDNAPKGPPFDTAEEREIWYTYCEDRMRTFQDMYQTLKRRMDALDRRLGNKQPKEISAPIKEEHDLNNSTESSTDSSDSESNEEDAVDHDNNDQNNGKGGARLMTLDNLDGLAAIAAATGDGVKDGRQGDEVSNGGRSLNQDDSASNNLDSDSDEQQLAIKQRKVDSEHSTVIVVKQSSRRVSLRGSSNSGANGGEQLADRKLQSPPPISMYDMFVEGRKRQSSEIARAKMLGLATSKTDEDESSRNGDVGGSVGIGVGGNASRQQTSTSQRSGSATRTSSRRRLY